MEPFWRENLLVQTQKKKAKKESSWFEEPRCKLGSNAGSNSRTQFASNESKVVSRNLNSSSKVGITHLSRKDMCCINLGPTNPWNKWIPFHIWWRYFYFTIYLYIQELFYSDVNLCEMSSNISKAQWTYMQVPKFKYLA
jgi:hypothetical protein